MKKTEGATFLMAYDKGSSHFSDLHFHDCTFDNCALSMVKTPQRMSRVQNVRLSKCRAVNSMIQPCMFEDVLIEDLSTNPILLMWASFFRRVKLVGKIGKLNLNLTPTAICKDDRILDQFAAARSANASHRGQAGALSGVPGAGSRFRPGVPGHCQRAAWL